MGARFVRPGFVVLVHGHSRVVLALLRHAASQVRPWVPSACLMLIPVLQKTPCLHSCTASLPCTACCHILVHPVCVAVLLQGIHFSVVVTEGGRDNTGTYMARDLAALKVPIVFILDSGIAYALEALK